MSYFEQNVFIISNRLLSTKHQTFGGGGGGSGQHGNCFLLKNLLFTCKIIYL